MSLFEAVLVMLVLLLLKGFFSGSEIALVSADRVKLRHRARQGHRGADLVLQAFRRPDQLLATTLIGTNLTTIALTTIGTVTVVGLFGPASGDLYAFAILTPLLLIFGEIIPKSVMQQVADAVAPIVVYPLRWFRYLVYPLIAVFSRVAHLVARLAGAGAADSKLFMTREQLSAVVEVAEKTSRLAAFDQGRIRKVMRVAQATVGEAMIPMAEVIAINRDHPIEEAIAKMRSADVNRLPVYKGIASNVVGIAVLESWDLMDPDVCSRSLASVTAPACFVWPGQIVEEVLPELATRADRMAVVVDEYGSAMGIVTLEDIIGKVVGDVDVGFDAASPANPARPDAYQKISANHYVFDARFPISEVNELLGLQLPTRDVYTIGGLVAGRLRHLPAAGESVVEGGYRFTVEEATERAPTKVRAEAVT